ncbi:hypothetical protein HDU97_009558 [Phlyctochytrium planicorne]|nr:hypothetical protein HDU97_009558 [Phlyctochytrium planicorne]
MSDCTILQQVFPAFIPPGNCCELRGVSCDGNGRVNFIRLDNLAINSPLPAALGQLSALESLDLSGNQYYGGFPDSWANLRNLKSLDISKNQIRGALPSWLPGLTNLQSLDLSRNNLAGLLGNIFSGMSNLRFINLGQNSLTGSLPAPQFWPGSLRTLILQDNKFTGSIPNVNADQIMFRPLKNRNECLDAINGSPDDPAPAPNPPSPPATPSDNPSSPPSNPGQPPNDSNPQNPTPSNSPPGSPNGDPQSPNNPASPQSPISPNAPQSSNGSITTRPAGATNATIFIDATRTVIVDASGNTIEARPTGGESSSGSAGASNPPVLIIGIMVAVIVFVLGVAFGLFMFRWYRRSREREFRSMEELSQTQPHFYSTDRSLPANLTVPPAAYSEKAAYIPDTLQRSALAQGTLTSAASVGVVNVAMSKQIEAYGNSPEAIDHTLDVAPSFVSWNVADVESWLLTTMAASPEVLNAFVFHGINGSDLYTITDDRLTQMGVGPAIIRGYILKGRDDLIRRHP